MIDRYLLIANEQKDPGLAFTKNVCEYLEIKGKKCMIVRTEEDRRTMHELLKKESDFLIVLGGDGTVMRAARETVGTDVPIMGINLGTIGYLAEAEPSNWRENLDLVLNGHYEIDSRMMLEGDVSDERGHSLYTAHPNYALNDIVIGRSGLIRIVKFNVYIDGMLLNSIEADGLIISTPTGSTAYNMSAGGPIVEPSAEMIIITPICPHTLNQRSLILSAEDRITVELGVSMHGTEQEAEVSFDGAISMYMHTGDRLEIKRSEKTTKLVQLSKKSFMETLYKKIDG